MRLQQYKELADSGAGSKFDYEQAQADVQDLEGQFASIVAGEAASSRETGGQRLPEGEQDEVAGCEGPDRECRGTTGQMRSEIEPRRRIVLLPMAPWLRLRAGPGAMAVPLPVSSRHEFRGG